MAVITKLSKSAIVESANQFGIGKVIRYWPASNGTENTNYFIETENNSEYVLTLIETGFEPSESMLTILDVASDAGLPVASAKKSSSGKSHITVENRPALLTKRLDGGHIASPSKGQCEAIGDFLAKFHLAAKLIQTKSYPRDSNWLQEKKEFCVPYLSYSSATLLKDTIQTVSSTLCRNDVARLPKGVIHGDLFRDNALFNTHALSGVIDFHHSAIGFWIYDLAVVLNDWCVLESKNKLDEERCRCVLSAYHQTRPLSEEELLFLPIFMEYGALSFWLSRLLVRIEATEKGISLPGHDPDAFRRLLIQHRLKPFHITTNDL